MRRFLHFRSLQQKLGFYAFVISLFAMVAVSCMTYRVARDQVRQDREQLMEGLADQIAQALEDELRRSARDVQLWAHLDFVQSSLGNGQPTRLGTLFDELISHDKKYDLIFTIDPTGRLSAASTIAQEDIGKPYQVLLPGIPPSWLYEALRSGKVQGIDWRQLPRVNELYKRTLKNSAIEARYQIAFAAPVEDLAKKQPLGVIVATVNWSHFQQVLDRAQEGFRRLGLTTGYAFLGNSNADTTIGSKYRDLYGVNWIKDLNLPELHKRAKRNPTGTVRYKWREGWKIVALAEIDPAELKSQFDWRLGVGINESDIFAPIQRLLSWFLIISLAVALSVVLLNLFVGRSLSVSLNEFAQLARDAARGRFSQLARARSDDEVGNLAQAFNEMLVSLRAQVPFTQIPNPYVVGNPIRTPDMFFGRQEDLEWIGHQLEQASNKMLLLFGPRRIGKTSLLHQISRGQASPKVLPFFIDSQQIIPEIECDSDFYHVLTRELLAQLPNALPGSSAPFVSAERFTPETLRKLLRFFHDVSPGKRPVLLFDELENLEFKFARGSLSTDIVLFLAGLLDAESPISFVASGSRRLENRDYRHWDILIPKVIPRRIGLLTRKEARRLIVEPVRGYVLYDEGVPEDILRVTAGHPYYTQVICQALVDYLNETRKFGAGFIQFSAAVDLVLRNPPPPLSQMWESLATPEKIAGAGLAQVLTGKEAYADPEAILQSVSPELRAKAGDLVSIRNALDNLCREDLVEKHERGDYRFRIDLLRLWMRREHSIWQVADELQRGSRG